MWLALSGAFSRSLAGSSSTELTPHSNSWEFWSSYLSELGLGCGLSELGLVSGPCWFSFALAFAFALAESASASLRACFSSLASSGVSITGLLCITVLGAAGLRESA